MKYFLILLLGFSQPIAAQTFSVIHEKWLRGDGRGTIEIKPEGIEYKSENEKDTHFWKWIDIQHLDRVSESEFVILGYENRRLPLGGGKQYRFRLTEGRLTDAIFDDISRQLTVPVTNRVRSGIAGVLYEVPVKHLHTLGGCQGVLRFTEDTIYYVTSHETDAREWKLSRDVQMVSSSDPYEFLVRAYENHRRDFSGTRVFRFKLKAPLNQDFYRRLQLHLYQIR